MSAAVALLKSDQITDPSTAHRVDNYCTEATRSSETLLFLKPVPLPDGTPRRPRKRIVVGEDGALRADKGAFRLKTFSGGLVTVDGIRSLHVLIRTRAQAGETVLVAGLPSGNANMQRMRRTSDTITDRPSHILVADVDDLPNYRGLNPVADPEAAAESIRCLLPLSLRRAAISIAFSSSTGLTGDVPAALSMHLRAWGDAGMDQDMRASLVRAVHRFAMARLVGAGTSPTGKVDDALARPVQLQSIASPGMPEGRPDPFEGSSRHVLLEGEDSFSFDALMEELAPYLSKEEPIPPRSGKTAGKSRIRRGPLPVVPVAQLAALDVPELAEVLPITVRRALEAATRLGNAPRREGATRPQTIRQAHAARSVLDLVRWSRSRAAWGEAVPALAAWHREGGVPEGLRDEFMVILQSRLGYALQGRGVEGRDFMDALAAVAGCCVDPRWFQEEWLGEGYHRSVTQRMARSRAGETVEWEGTARAPLYWHNPATIRAILGIHEAEAEALGLSTLAPRAARERMRRRSAGARTAGAVAGEAATLRAKARRLRGRGMSHAAIGSACGRSATWARRAVVGIRSAPDRDGRRTAPATAINPEISAGIPCGQGSHKDSIRTPCVTSKEDLDRGEPLSYVPAHRASTPRSLHLRTGTLDSPFPGTPCVDGLEQPDGCTPGRSQDASHASPGLEGCESVLGQPGVGASGAQAAEMPSEEPAPSVGLRVTMEAPSGRQCPASPVGVGADGNGLVEDLKAVQAVQEAPVDFEFLVPVAPLGEWAMDGRADAALDDRGEYDCLGSQRTSVLSATADAAEGWNARLTVPQGAMPGFGAWAWRGRHAVRGGRPVWISGAGVVVSRGGQAAENAPDWVRVGFAAAQEAAYGPRRAALRLLEQRAVRDARASAAEQAYRAWLTSQGRGEVAVVVPPESRDWEVPGTASWLADGLARLIRVLKRRVWRHELERLRRAEPLLVGAVIASLPTPLEERTAWSDGLAREAARVERVRVGPGAGQVPASSPALSQSSAPSRAWPSGARRTRCQRRSHSRPAWRSKSRPVPSWCAAVQRAPIGALCTGAASFQISR